MGKSGIKRRRLLRQGKSYSWYDHAEYLKFLNDLKEEVRKAYGDQCCYCLLPFTMEDPRTLEHLEEISMGGKDIKENCRLAHQSCNNRVRGLSLQEKLSWIESISKSRSKYETGEPE